MRTTKSTNKSIRYTSLACAGISLLCCGCISFRGKFENWAAYKPAQCPIPIQASATVDVTVTTRKAHGQTSELATGWSTEDWNWAVGKALRNDLTTSGLFSSIVATNTQPDYHVELEWVAVWQWITGTHQAMLKATEVATGAQITETGQFETQGWTAEDWPAKAQGLMNALKTKLVGELQQRMEKREAELVAKARLPDLVMGPDASVALAQARNHAIIAAKNEQLSAILRESKTSELTALTVKIEQAILDLNHASEVANDKAQQAAAAGQGAQQIDELRGQAISCRERIELLKPIAVAFKEEIANRNR